MIDCYCRVCGLYVSAPDDYAGGRGACPRCRSMLRIPHPLTAADAEYMDNIRYLSDSLEAKPSEKAVVVTDAMGPSCRYRCEACEEVFESLRSTGWQQGRCPACGHVTQKPIDPDVSFPRPGQAPSSEDSHAGREETDRPRVVTERNSGHELLEMQGEFLVAKPSSNQNPSDSLIEAVPLEEDVELARPAEEETPAEPEQEAPAQKPSTPAPASEPTAASASTARPTSEDRPPASPTSSTESEETTPEIEPSGAEGWSYLLKGKPHGPVSADELKSLIRKGKIKHSVLIYRDGMDAWVPVESVEEFREELPEEHGEEEEENLHQEKIAAASKPLVMARRCTLLMWSAITFGCIVIVLFATRRTMSELGTELFRTVNLLVGALMLVPLGLGVWQLAKHWPMFLRVPTAVRAKAMVGIGGLICCIGVALVLAFGVHTRSSDELARINREAEQIYRALHNARVEQIHTLDQYVNWEELTVNGRNFGREYTEADGFSKKQQLIADFLDEFQAGGTSVGSPADVDSRRLRIDKEYAEVRIDDPRQKHSYLLKIKGGMLVGVEIR
jgi:hypothetical protein